MVLGIAGLFPGYLGGASLSQQADQVLPHVIYLAAWAASAVLLLFGSSRRAIRPAEQHAPGARPDALAQRVGSLVALGTSGVTFGLFFADLGTVISGGSKLAGTGLVLSLIGWLACAVGSVLAVTVWRAGSLTRPRGRESLLALALTAVAALGAAIAFAPSWDSYTLRTAAGAVQSLTAGNAFANPGLVIFGDIAVMVAVVAFLIAAASWQPVRLGAAILAGATVPLVAQAVSALLQIRTAPSPLQFGFSPAQARQAGLTIATGLTPAFWIYCAFVVAVVLIGARMLTSPEPAPAAPTSAIAVTADAGAAPSPGRMP